MPTSCRLSGAIWPSARDTKGLYKYVVRILALIHEDIEIVDFNQWRLFSRDFLVEIL